MLSRWDRGVEKRLGRGLCSNCMIETKSMDIRTTNLSYPSYTFEPCRNGSIDDPSLTLSAFCDPTSSTVGKHGPPPMLFRAGLGILSIFSTTKPQASKLGVNSGSFTLLKA